MSDVPRQEVGHRLSGTLLVETRDLLEIQCLKLALSLRTVYKKPFVRRCVSCTVSDVTLYRWEFVTSPSSLGSGNVIASVRGSSTNKLAGLHLFPFSCTLSNSLPATFDTPLVSKVFQLAAEAMTTSGLVMETKVPIQVGQAPSFTTQPYRAAQLLDSGLMIMAEYDHRISLANENHVSFRLAQVSHVDVRALEQPPKEVYSVYWRLEEIVRTFALPCYEHSSAVVHGSSSEWSGIGPVRLSCQTLGSGKLNGKWKIDSQEQKGDKMIFALDCDRGNDFSVDIRTNDGTEVTHRLVLELRLRGQTQLPRLVPKIRSKSVVRAQFPLRIAESGCAKSNEQVVPYPPPPYLDIRTLSPIELNI